MRSAEASSSSWSASSSSCSAEAAAEPAPRTQPTQQSQQTVPTLAGTVSAQVQSTQQSELVDSDSTQSGQEDTPPGTVSSRGFWRPGGYVPRTQNGSTVRVSGHFVWFQQV